MNKKTIIFLLLVLMGIISLTSCATKNDSVSKKEILEQKSSKSSSSIIFMQNSFSYSVSNSNFEYEGISVKAKNDTLEVSLRGNATTGYSWEFDESSDPENLFILTDSKYVPDEVPRGMVGVGGVSYFTFKAQKEGKAELSFIYIRSWEDNYINHVSLNVSINDKNQIIVTKVSK